MPGRREASGMRGDSSKTDSRATGQTAVFEVSMYRSSSDCLSGRRSLKQSLTSSSTSKREKPPYRGSSSPGGLGGDCDIVKESVGQRCYAVGRYAGRYG